MSGKAIGIGVAVILFVVILYFVFSGDDKSTTVASSEEVPEPEVNDPPCSEFECGEGLETKDGELGTTSQQCCQKPLCPPDICTANNVEFKDPIENARGDTVDECCEDALCRADICSEGYKLSGTRLGRTNDECCVQKPLCFPSVSGDVTSGIDVDCEDTHTPKPGEPRGSTKDECCTSNSCFENDFGDIVVDGDGGGGGGGGCANENMEPKENLDTLLGYTKEVCCQHPFCTNDITCPEGKTINGSLRGSDAESCCVAASCDENGWNDDSFIPPGGTERIGISKCKFYSNQTKSRKDDLENVTGNSVEECCEEKLCSNNYFYDERCAEGEITATSPCFKMDNIIPGKPLSTNSENMKKNCASLGKKLAPDGTLLPVTGDADDTDDTDDADDTCCVSLTCGELKEKEPTNDLVNCDANGIFNPEGISDINPSDGDGTATPCCSASTCAESYQGNDKCSDPATYNKSSPTDVYNYSRYGGSDSDDAVSVNIENMKYDITKGPSPAGPECCVPKTCADLGFNDEKCKRISSGDKLSDPSKAGNFVEGNGEASCCREKPCSQKTEEELNRMCSWNMTKKSVLPTEGEASKDTCCEYRKCSDIGWDDDKCKDREYTRASVRGKAKKDADGESISLDNTSNTGGESKWTADLAKTNTASGFEGDKYCCEQDLKNNFARMCVGNEWRNGSIHNLSPGANIADSDGQPITPVPGQNNDTIYGKSNVQCMNSCKDDDRCTSFTLGANTNHSWAHAPHNQEKPSCRLYQKLGSSVNVNNLITSEWGHKRTNIQYFSGNTFPEQYRYSGGEISVGNNKLLTGTGKGIGNVRWNNNNSSHQTYSGRPERHTATSIAWGNGNLETAPFNDHMKRKEIYLAGVDREFCPVDFVKHYGTWRNNGSTATAGTWHGQSSKHLNMVSNSEGLWASGSGGRGRDSNGCDIDINVNASLDDCYRNLNCNWSWIGAANPPKEGTQGDNGSSAVFKSPINSSNLHRKRRVCHKKNFNKNSASSPSHMATGGASVAPTRMVVDGKLKFGVMPDKAPKSGDAFWKEMIITSIGDSSQAD